MTNDIFLGGIAYRLGETYPITSIKDADPDKVDLFSNIGLQNYCRSDESIAEMAYHAISETLSKTTINAAEVSSLIIASTVDSIHSVGIEYKDMDRILENFCLINAKLYGCSLSKCSNLSAALELGLSLLQTQGLPHVLIVVADKYSDKTDRFMDSNESILSDGATSFLLSKEELEYQLLHLETKNDLSHINREYNIFEFLDNSVKQLNTLWEQLKNQHPYDSFDKLFFGNYNSLLQRSYRSTMGIDEEKLFLSNLAKYGHVFSADTLINLKDYSMANTISSGQKYACFTVGYFRWGCFALQRT